MIVNKAVLSDIIGKSERTLSTWQKNGMPIKFDGTRGEQNQYETADVINWIVDREIATRVQQHGGDNENFYDYELERGRLTHHQANKTALEEQRLAGELIDQDFHEEIISDMAATIRANALAIPTKGAHLFLNLSELEEIQAHLKTLIYDLLEELTTYDPSSNIKSIADGILSVDSATT